MVSAMRLGKTKYLDSESSDLGELAQRCSVRASAAAESKPLESKAKIPRGIKIGQTKRDGDVMDVRDMQQQTRTCASVPRDVPTRSQQFVCHRGDEIDPPMG